MIDSRTASNGVELEVGQTYEIVIDHPTVKIHWNYATVVMFTHKAIIFSEFRLSVPMKYIKAWKL